MRLSRAFLFLVLGVGITSPSISFADFGLGDARREAIRIRILAQPFNPQTTAPLSATLSRAVKRIAELAKGPQSDVALDKTALQAAIVQISDQVETLPVLSGPAGPGRTDVFEYLSDLATIFAKLVNEAAELQAQPKAGRSVEQVTGEAAQILIEAYLTASKTSGSPRRNCLYTAGFYALLFLASVPAYFLFADHSGYFSLPAVISGAAGILGAFGMFMNANPYMVWRGSNHAEEAEPTLVPGFISWLQRAGSARKLRQVLWSKLQDRLFARPRVRDVLLQQMDSSPALSTRFDLESVFGLLQQISGKNGAQILHAMSCQRLAVK